MKEIMVFFLFMVGITTSFAQSIVLDNQVTNHTENPKTKMAIQWATSAKDVAHCNNMVRRRQPLKQDSLKVITSKGMINLKSPQEAEYFRVLVWSNGTGDPDLLTNWVDIVPNKTYTLNKGHLIPLVLMSGTGC